MSNLDNSTTKGEIRLTIRADLLDKDISDFINSRVKAISREQVDKCIYEEVNRVVESRLTPENIDNIIRQIAERSLSRSWSTNKIVTDAATKWVEKNAPRNTVQALFKDSDARAAIKDIVRDVLKNSL